MNDAKNKIPLDGKLLSYAIIELNISRRNVSIYPAEHPLVARSLNRAFEFLKKLFELRPEITLAIAKDTIIVDDYQLDKKNPVFSEFALSLNKMHIAYVTFKHDITKNELYKFHRFLSEKTDNLTVDEFSKVFSDYHLPHVSVGFVDYGTFSSGEIITDKKTREVPIWERYVYSLMQGRLQSDEIEEGVRDIPPALFAKLLNRFSDADIQQETYDKVITSYIGRSSQKDISGQDLKRMFEFINTLRPELKKKFLSSSVRTFSEDINSAYETLQQISFEDVIAFLDVANEQRIAIPQNLMDIINRLSYRVYSYTQTVRRQDGLLVDDVYLPPESAEMLQKGDFATSIDSTYQQKIQSLLRFDASGLKTSQLIEFETEFYDDLIEKRFHQIVLELMSSETTSEEGYRAFLTIVKEQAEQLLWIGEFRQFLEMLRIIELNKAQYRYPEINAEALQHYHSPEFIVLLIDAFRILGRQKRHEVSMICEYYGKKILPYLLDSLAEEESQIIRRFLMDQIKQFGETVIPEVIKRLADERWFVKRNMLYLLGETESSEVADHIKPYCRDSNLKVSVTAVKCLLNVGDRYATEILKDFLGSKVKDKIDQAVMLAGSFRVKEVVGDLVGLLNKTGLSGADIHDKIPIVRALGDIGDTQAIPALRELLSKKRFFFRSVFELLKEEIYKTLKNYPYESVKDLVQDGVTSRNEVIRTESLQLRKGP